MTKTPPQRGVCRLQKMCKSLKKYFYYLESLPIDCNDDCLMWVLMVQKWALKCFFKDLKNSDDLPALLMSLKG